MTSLIFPCVSLLNPGNKSLIHNMNHDKNKVYTFDDNASCYIVLCSSLKSTDSIIIYPFLSRFYHVTKIFGISYYKSMLFSQPFAGSLLKKQGCESEL